MKETDKERQRLLDILEWAALYYHQQLKSEAGQKAWNYALDRGISPEYLEKFRIGFASTDWAKLSKAAAEQGFTWKELEEAGLSLKSRKDSREYYDRFRNRLMFPILNMEGKPIAFGGRTLGDEQPKYLNSPETHLFSKSKVLYGMNFARSSWLTSHRILIVEGYVDLIIAHQYGYVDAVATLGTTLSDYHTKMMRRYIQDVVLVYDGDEAGQKATYRSILPLLREGLMVRMIVLPSQVDPSDFLVEHGASAFEEKLQHSQDFWDFQIQRIAGKYDLKDVSSQRYAVQELMNTVKEIPDDLTKQLLLNKIAEIFKIPKELLAKYAISAEQLTQGSASPNPLQKLFVTADEKFLLWAVIHYPQYRTQIFANYPPNEFQNQELAQLADYLQQEMSQSNSLDIPALSCRMEDTRLSETLIRLYWDQYEDNEDVISQRLGLIFKGLRKIKHRQKLAKLKQQFARVDENDSKLKGQILEITKILWQDYLEKK